MTIKNPMYIFKYIHRGKVMISTKVFKSGNSQAVRIPKEFYIDYSEMFIKKIGSSIILTPKKSNWENLERSLSEFSDDFMEGERNQPSIQQREEI